MEIEELLGKGPGDPDFYAPPMPMSPRTYLAEERYQKDKAKGFSKPLELEPSLQQWQYWRLIDNAYPYDLIYQTHHMLLPKRAGVAERWDLNEAERTELEILIGGFIYPGYDVWFENCPKRRSKASIYHLHLGVYLAERPLTS